MVFSALPQGLWGREGERKSRSACLSPVLPNQAPAVEKPGGLLGHLLGFRCKYSSSSNAGAESYLSWLMTCQHLWKRVAKRGMEYVTTLHLGL